MKSTEVSGPAFILLYSSGDQYDHHAKFGSFIQAVAQMQSTLKSLTTAAQQQRQQNQAVLQAQQQRIDALKLAFHKQAQELSALQNALKIAPASKGQGLNFIPQNSLDYNTQVQVTPNLLQSLKPALVD